MNAPPTDPSDAPARVPTRHSNPFATCWTRPGALPFLPNASASVDECWLRLRGAAWRGQVLGAHGVGKSTLLAALARKARRRGVLTRELSGRTGASPAQSWREIAHAREARATKPLCIVFLDGFECLSSFRRFHWRRAAQRRGFGLVVTSHAPAGLPTIAQLRPRLPDVLAAYDVLTAARPTPVRRSCVEAAFARRGGNVREVWFDLYDLHERLSR